MKNDMMAEFEKFIEEKDKREEAEMMEDFVKMSWDTMTPAEIAQCIREGVITLESVESAIKRDLK